ncbi:hypothetical protein [Selenomonas sp.]|uniref:hypothetical protein n=1 Tax=Selenomonas sp. TaxID=2053611 RepID=UPI0025D50D1B|nr:hypothetical protein [Selenomonas sp.]
MQQKKANKKRAQQKPCAYHFRNITPRTPSQEDVNASGFSGRPVPLGYKQPCRARAVFDA